MKHTTRLTSSEQDALYAEMHRLHCADKTRNKVAVVNDAFMVLPVLRQRAYAPNSSYPHFLWKKYLAWLNIGDHLVPAGKVGLPRNNKPEVMVPNFCPNCGLSIADTQDKLGPMVKVNGCPQCFVDFKTVAYHFANV